MNAVGLLDSPRMYVSASRLAELGLPWDGDPSWAVAVAVDLLRRVPDGGFEVVDLGSQRAEVLEDLSDPDYRATIEAELGGSIPELLEALT